MRVAEDDLKLLAAWREGDAAAGEALFERHFESVFRFVRSKVGDGAEDLVQQVFLACVEGRDRFRAEASFSTYLFAAARNVIYDYWKARSRPQMEDFRDTAAHALDPSPSSAVAHKDNERLLVQALRRIPLDLQMALELYYVEGLRSREVADVLGIPHGTVRSRLRRGLELVREFVEQLRTSDEERTDTLSRLDAWAKDLRDD
jgi:RNA polymerase sigma-70 factor (ECF subfamily)